MKLVNLNDHDVYLPKEDGTELIVTPFGKLNQPHPANAVFVVEDPWFERFVKSRQLSPMPEEKPKAVLAPPEKPNGWRDRQVESSVRTTEAPVADQQSVDRPDSTSSEAIPSTVKPKRGRK